MNVFLSFNSRDRPAARRVADALGKRGIETFLDERSLVPGQRWHGKLAEALNSYHSAAILLGPHGLGAWQHNELQLALNRQTREGDKFPVIPVLLNGFDVERTPLGFLELTTSRPSRPSGASGWASPPTARRLGSNGPPPRLREENPKFRRGRNRK